jgi:Flavoprotein/Phage integrase family
VLGARRGELCGLRWQHIDLDRGEVLLERGVVYVTGQSLIDKATKTRSKRRLALDVKTVELLRAHRERAEQVAGDLGINLPASAYVFSREPDGSRPMSPSYMTQQFVGVARSVGVRCRLHDLRHLMVTYLISQGVDWRTAAGRAGHAGPHMTLGTYAHSSLPRTAPPPSCSPHSAMATQQRPPGRQHGDIRGYWNERVVRLVSEVTQMGKPAPRGMLYVVVCAAPPAAELQGLVKLAQAAGWKVAVTATPDALAFIDAPLLAAVTGFPVRHQWREPDEPESVPEADAIVVAPATFNTINKWVAGITDTIAVGTLCEYLGLDAPIVAAPNVNPPLARHPTFRASLRRLREWGVRVLFDESAPREARMASWDEILEEINRAHEATGWPPRGTPETGPAASAEGAAP